MHNYFVLGSDILESGADAIVLVHMLNNVLPPVTERAFIKAGYNNMMMEYHSNRPEFLNEPSKENTIYKPLLAYRYVNGQLKRLEVRPSVITVTRGHALPARFVIHLNIVELRLLQLNRREILQDAYQRILKCANETLGATSVSIQPIGKQILECSLEWDELLFDYEVKLWRQKTRTLQ